ncbi:DNA adenine methylase [Methylobacterium sp. Leaf88]|uniref:DNA adenine methylase n=1 Tax=Methylobacterium sp. Leaf88 TaxID=1736244 RepID=UPI0006F64316|nr:DNA adenine methylase [Methylobacterium sp. Leaf88]KQO70626.1 hypothetical protein ASF20_19200 [Methylobacterium sp. Leaf88]
MRYPGGKGRTYQILINLMPPHRVYIESHLGGGAVMRMKRPANRSIGVDRDPTVLDRWRLITRPDLELHAGDAAGFLERHPFKGDELVYADPPYWPGSRRRVRCYRHDYTNADHHRLLDVLLSLPCMVVLSGYRCAPYDTRLRDWIRTDYMAASQAGAVPESAWTNFQPGPVLHDYSYVGASFRAREALRRRRETNYRRLAEAPALERMAVLADLADTFPEEVLATAARICV